MTRGAADWAWQNGGIAGDCRQIVGRCDGLPQMDQTDRRLMTELSRNARLPVATLARRLGLARSTVQARLDRLEGSGAIAGYAVIPGPGAAPERMRATVLLQVEPQAGAAVLQRLRAMGTDLAFDQGLEQIPPVDVLYLQRKAAGLYLLGRRLRARVPLRSLLEQYIRETEHPALNDKEH
jgi:DNA-binding Lrp family transcriptional regulator